MNIKSVVEYLDKKFVSLWNCFAYIVAIVVAIFVIFFIFAS